MIQIMIVLSLNIREIGGTLKDASFQRLLEHSKPDVIFLQETLSANKKSRDFLHHFCPLWVTAAVNSIGNSGGLLVAWDPSLFYLNPFMTCGGILFIGRCFATNQELVFLNVYGPCQDRSHFWTHLEKNGILSLPNLILGGNLNIILSEDEHWGGSFLSGSSENLYRDLFTSKNLINILLSRLVPT